MTNLDKIGKDHANLILEAFSFLSEEKLKFIKNTRMFRFLNNNYEKEYRNGDIYKLKTRPDKTNDYIQHSQIICKLELDLLSDLEIITSDEYNRLNSMLLSKDPEIVKLAESIIYEKRPIKRKKISKLKKIQKNV